MSEKKKCIEFQLKGAKSVTSDYVDAAEAQRLLEEVVLPGIGGVGAISVPGAVVNAAEVISATTKWPPSFGIA